MRNFDAIRGAVVVMLLVTFAGMFPVSADIDTLNHVKLGMTFKEVLAATFKPPDLIGPTLSSVDEVNNILNPPPASSTGAGVGMPGMPGAPGMPGMPGVMTPPVSSPMPSPSPMPPSGMPGPFTSGPSGTSSTPDLVPKGRSDYVIWVYKDHSGITKMQYVTYVVFNRGLATDADAGKVVGVVLWQISQVRKSDKSNLDTPVPELQLGSNMTELIAKYNYPKPLAKIDANFFLAYPDQQIAYTVSATSHKVIGIAIGAKMLTVVSRTSTTTPAATTGATPATTTTPIPPTGLPGPMPGMSPMVPR